jgi:hypothetical protein
MVDAPPEKKGVDHNSPLRRIKGDAFHPPLFSAVPDNLPLTFWERRINRKQRYHKTPEFPGGASRFFDLAIRPPRSHLELAQPWRNP